MDWNKLLSEERFKNSSRQKTEFDLRNEFESDYGRIMFSPAIRRMHDKTQVFPLTSDDNIHTRLTHSMEVQSIAQSLAVNLIENETIKINGFDKSDLLRNVVNIVASISICHDIGNPPFGHFGEKVIGSFFEEYFEKNKGILKPKEQKDFTKFNGNAQGFRILTKLQVLQDQAGLNLTAATLASFLKYPNLSEELKGKEYQKKLGVYQSEKKHLKFIREKTNLNQKRHPLAFIMEAADSTCYLTMDIEDGFNRKYYTYNDVISYLKEHGNEDVLNYTEELIKKIENKVIKGINEERTKIVSLRIALIQKLVETALKSFIENYDKILSGNYYDELIFEKCQGSLGRILQDFARRRIFAVREVQRLELTGETILRGLLNHFVDDFINYDEKESKNSIKTEKLYSLISNSLKTIIKLETGQDNFYEWNNYYKLRIIVDYISGMTDKFALQLFQELQGIKI